MTPKKATGTMTLEARPVAGAATAPPPLPDATAHATRELRDMIMRGQLAPGQQLRQEALAVHLSISRSPLREALRSLEIEGFVRHAVNQGYFVVQLSAPELEQVYLMRRLLETELFRSARPPSGAELKDLRAMNAQVAAAARAGSIAGMLVSNRQFHFTMFALSQLELVVRQVERLWHLSEPYRATYLWLPETRGRIVAEHEAMIQAIADGDRRGLVRLADQHRRASEEAVLSLIAHLGANQQTYPPANTR
jgi:DNA-binding GntR family transcriptional regulator